jgi:catechol 2,3-dioxygenase-like lactoylglutathione lyase family enzyme
VIRGGRALVYVSDVARAVKFWVEVMGAKLVVGSPQWSVLDLGGIELAVHPKSEHAAAPGVAGAIGLGLDVDDIESAVAVYANRGVTFERVSTPHVELAYFGDPDGNRFYLAQPKR